jgi:hypothetical protein
MGVRSLHCSNHVYTFFLLCLRSYVRHAIVALIASVANQLAVLAPSIMLSDGNALYNVHQILNCCSHFDVRDAP